MTEKAREIKLDCGHSLWMKNPYPNVGERLWCSGCQAYEFVGPMHELETVLHDTWKSVKRGRLYHGHCVTKGCEYVAKGVNFYVLKGTLELHYIRAHTNSTLIFREPIALPDRLPANSPPPF